MHPAPLHKVAMYAQQAWASLRLKATRFVRTRRQSSLARTHVRMYLNLLSVSCRSFWRLNSKLRFSNKVARLLLLRFPFYSFRITNNYL